MIFSVLSDNKGQETEVLIRLTTAANLPQPKKCPWIDPSHSHAIVAANDRQKAIIGTQNWNDIKPEDKQKLLTIYSEPFDKSLCTAAKGAGWALYRGYLDGPLTLVPLVAWAQPPTSQPAATQPVGG